MYQQALTTIESRMPQMFFDHKIVYYDNTNTYYADNIKVIKEKVNKKYQANEDYVFNAYLNMCNLDADSTKKEVTDEVLRKYIADDAYDSYRCIGRNGFDYKLSDSGRQYECIIKLMSDTGNIRGNKTGKVIAMHKALKMCRNYINHSNPDRPNMELIVEVMKVYVKDVETLLNSKVSKSGYGIR